MAHTTATWNMRWAIICIHMNRRQAVALWLPVALTIIVALTILRGARPRVYENQHVCVVLGFPRVARLRFDMYLALVFLASGGEGKVAPGKGVDSGRKRLLHLLAGEEFRL